MHQKRKLKILHKGLLIVLVPLIFQLVFISILAFLYHCSESARAEAESSRRIMAQTNMLASNYAQAGRCLVDAAISEDPDAELQFNQLMSGIPDRWRELESQCQNRPTQLRILKQALPRARLALDALMEAKHTLAQQGGILVVFKSRHDQKKVAGLVSQVANDLMMISREEKRLEGNAPEREITWQRLLLLSVGIGVLLNCAIAIILVIYFSQEIAARLDVLKENTLRLSTSRPLHPALPEGDEIASVDAAFHKMVESLKQLEEQRNELIAIVSHDIRTPLTSIQCFFDAASKGVYGTFSNELRTNLATSEGEMARLIMLLNDLLDDEKERKNEISLILDTTSLQDVFAKAILATSHMAQAKRIKVESTQKLVLVYADEDRLVQVVVNLLANAIKYSPKEGKVELQIVEHNANLVEVQVCDQGLGVSAEMSEIIFNKFVQADSAARERRGHGLGLYICKSIVEGHGGTIGVRSKNGDQGSVFWFKLPVPDRNFDRQPLPLQEGEPLA